MIGILLGKWEQSFPGGVSQANYQRIGRLIRRLGPLVKIFIRVGNHESLEKALDELERKHARSL